MAKGLGSAKIPEGAGVATPTKVDGATRIGPLSHKSEPGRAVIPLTVNDAGEAERVGHYEVAGALGRGGMGVVYEVVDDRSGSMFALKTIETRFLELPESNAEQRFRQEISVLERLDHPGIVRLYDSGFALHPMGYHLAFFVMERLEGDTLELDIKQKRIFDLEEALGIIQQLAAALDYLGKHGVLHRDIKPANIFRERAGRVVLMDFGLARSEEFTRLTIAGQIVGTFGYMSPERLTGKKLDISSDVYALGVVLFQMLTGEHPFGAPSPTEMLEAIRRGVTLPARLDELPRAPEVKSLLTAMLAYGRDGRPTPAALAARIDDLLGKLEESAPTSRPRPERPAKISATPTRAIPARAQAPIPTPTVAVSESALTPIIERTSGGANPTQPSAPVSNLPFVPVRTGPSWATTGLLSTAAACVAFLAGLLAGRSPAPEVIQPVTPQQGALLAQQREAVARGPAVTPRPAPDPQPNEPPAAAIGDAVEAYRIGERLVLDDKHAPAIEYLSRSLELNPAYANAYKLLGDAFAGMNDPERAAHNYKTYLALRPGADDAPSVKRALKALAP